jgi:hypothetical protein
MKHHGAGKVASFAALLACSGRLQAQPAPPGAHGQASDLNGFSSGHWEGDTLVVKSFAFATDKLLDNYLPSSESLELLERVRLLDSDTLEDRITITDPANFTRPWETAITYKRQPDEPLPEDVCLDRKSAGAAPLPR